MEKIIVSDIKEESLTLSTNEHLTYIVFSLDQENNPGKGLNVTLNKDASLTIYNIVLSNVDTTLDETVYLNEPGANVTIINVLLATNKSQMTSNINIYHQTGYTTSTFENYGIVKDQAKMILNNNATIKKGARKSVAKQSAKGLTLSKEAYIKAMPNLFIDEYDVIANHAAAIGSISKEDLFYLESRGLSNTDATNLVVLGFIKPIVDKLTDESLKKKIAEAFTSKLLN